MGGFSFQVWRTHFGVRDSRLWTAGRGRDVRRPASNSAKRITTKGRMWS